MTKGSGLFLTASFDCGGGNLEMTQNKNSAQRGVEQGMGWEVK